MVDCFASFTDPSDPGPVVYPGDTIVIPGNGIVDEYDETVSGSTSGACGAGAVTLTINDAVAGRIYTVVLNGYGTLTQLDATTWCWVPPSDEDERDGSSIDIKIGEHILYTYVPHFCCRNGMTISGSTSVEPDSETEYTVVFSDPWSGCDYDWNATDGYIVGGTFIAPSTPGVVTISVTPFLADDMGEECATLDVTVESPCGGESIGYTTLQMSVSGSQTLTVVNPVTGKTYGWIASSGSLSAATGLSVVYTAPATNANCASNPTITLTCGGAQVDSISITVNAYSNRYSAAYISLCTGGDPYNMSICDREGEYPWCWVAVRSYNCIGEDIILIRYGYPDLDCGYAMSLAQQGGLINCRYDGCIRTGDPCSCGGYEIGKNYDVRTTSMKENGCCPFQLL